MGCNNKDILKGNSETEKLIEELLSYTDDEIKRASHKHCVQVIT